MAKKLDDRQREIDAARREAARLFDRTLVTGEWSEAWGELTFLGLQGVSNSPFGVAR